MVIDLTENVNQYDFYLTSIAAVHGKNDFRNLFYGGAIRGGKSIVCASNWLTFAKYFPESRWHVIRESFPALQGTTIPTFEKIIGGSPAWGWNRDRANYFLYNRKTDGKIFFKGENIAQDPELNYFLGLETNGLWYEQMEELSEKTFEIGTSRAGSWYIDKMPTPIQLGTFNPTQTWIKKKVFEPWMKGELKAPYFFKKALPGDNPFVTKEQWNAWNNMADRYKKQFIEGDWSDFTDKNKLWAFAFDSQKHVPETYENLQPRRENTLFLSFDFNRNPICCSVIQWYGNVIRVLETIKLANSDVYALCKYIKAYYPGYLYMVTGDATGKNGSAIVRDNINAYTIIKDELNISNSQMRIPTVNPGLSDNQVLFNSVLANYPFIVHKEKAAGFIFDCNNVKMVSDGKIEKTDRTDPTQQADALDTVRYWINVFMGNFLK